MTANQIAYWNLNESKRHNVASEAEANRHNVTTEDETHRHNLVTEQTDISKLQETQRHNIATETEAKRHNEAGEVLQAIQQQEQQRHNQVTESVSWTDIGEQQRHNLQQEMLQNTSLSIDAQKAFETSRHNAQTEAVAEAEQKAEQAYKEAMVNVNALRASNEAQLNQAKLRQINKQVQELDRQYNLAKSRNTRENWNAAMNNAEKVANMAIKIGGLFYGKK